MRPPVLAVCSLAPLLLGSCFAPTEAEEPLPGPVQGSAVFAMPDSEDRRVLAWVLLQGEPEEIFPWFTNDQLISLWLAEDARNAETTGGEFYLAWPSVGEVMRGNVVGSEPPHWLEAELKPYAYAGPTHLRLSTWKEAPGYTRVRIEQWPFEASMEGEAVADSHRVAWFNALRVLRSGFNRRLPAIIAPPPGPPRPVVPPVEPIGPER